MSQDSPINVSLVINSQILSRHDLLSTPGQQACSEAVTGAGAVVTKDVPPGRLVAGFPAKVNERKHKTN